MEENVYKDIYEMLVDKLKNRLMELQPTDSGEINNALQTFNKAITILKVVQLGTEDEKVLDTLGSLTFIGKDEIHEDYKYELYISARVSEDESPEIVLKTGRVGTFVSYLKKNNNSTESTETLYLSSDKFYGKYRKFTEYLKQAYFHGSLCSLKETSNNVILLYFYVDIVIVLDLKTDKVIVAKYSDISIDVPYIRDILAIKYKNEEILYDKIYNSFFGRVEEIKLKREKNI